MKIFSSPRKIQNFIKKCKSAKKNVGLVPTMGALHRAHISLIRRARRENALVAVSIFVNPAQFGPAEDFGRYPRPFKKDAAICKKENVDVVFAPAPEDMYPANYLTYITVEKLSDIMCGKFRPGHFRGVATVVAKLFNIVQPDKAYFGLKDYQQLVVIKKMAADLNFPVKIIGCPLVREKDGLALHQSGTGLALSSRNIYLSASQRQKAIMLSRSLQTAENLIRYKKVKSAQAVISEIRKNLVPYADKIDYVEIRDAETLGELKIIDGKVVVAAAVFIGKTRLIDNVVI